MVKTQKQHEEQEEHEENHQNESEDEGSNEENEDVDGVVPKNHNKDDGSDEKEDTPEEEKENNENFDPLAKLNEEQMEALKEMRKKAEEYAEDESERKWCNDMCLLRYLRARDYHVSKAEKMLKATLEWKREVHPDAITVEEVEPLARHGVIYTNGFDKKGRPVIVMRPAREGLAKVHLSSEIKFKHLLYWLENGFKKMDESKGVETVCLVTDYKDYSRKVMDMKTNLHVMHYMLNHLPERLGVSLFLDPPLLFWVGWKIISPFLNEVTLAKVRFLYSKPTKDGRRFCPEMLNYIDADQLEEEYGGNNKKTFNYDSYVNNNYEIV